MAKKSTAARQASAARRSQSASRAPEVTLVRQQPKTAGVDNPPATTTNTTTKATASTSTPSSPATDSRPAAKSNAPIVVGTTTRSRVPEVVRSSTTAKSAGAKPETGARPPSRPPVARAPRAQGSQRVRTANRIAPEQYAYVKNDLKLIATLAGSMFVIIIILHFVLPLILPQ